MNYIRAYSIVSVAQLSGYTDQTPVMHGDSNYCRHLCYQACGFDFNHKWSDNRNKITLAVMVSTFLVFQTKHLN